MQPENRLEFMWKRARSAKRQSSLGNEPVIPAWLRSIPATVVIRGLSGAGAQ